MMQQKMRSFLLGPCLMAAVAAWPVGAMARAKIVTFDVPGATTTYPLSINAKGVVAGYWIDDSSLHGFVRQPDGTIATFDVPGSDPIFGTQTRNINDKGYVTGNYATLNKMGFDVAHVFVRRPNGTIDTFGVPNDIRYDQPAKITKNGTVIGNFVNGETNFGFIKPRHGIATMFQDQLRDTIVTAANNLNVATGYSPSENIAFVRAADGRFTHFSGNDGIAPFGINDSGTIVGESDFDGFIRTPDGIITTFVVDDTITIAAAVNNKGALTGYTLGNEGEHHGFVRDARGKITVFDADGAEQTVSLAINDNGVTTGAYVIKEQYHGFIRYP